MATTQQLINAVRNVYLMAHNNGFRYGGSLSLPPCADGLIACDRLVARALWDVGYTDQPPGGVTCLNIESYLLGKKFKRIADPNKLKAGDIVLIETLGHPYADGSWHVYFINSFSSVNSISKYDMGSQERIWMNQPFTNVPVNEWGGRQFHCALRLPNDVSSANWVFIKPGKYRIVLGADENYALSFHEEDGMLRLQKRDDSDSQIFNIKRHKNVKGVRDYAITPKESKKTVATAKKNFSLSESDWKNQKTSLWKISSNGDGSYMIFNASSSLPLGTAGGNIWEGVEAGTWGDDGSSAQEWKLIKV